MTLCHRVAAELDNERRHSSPSAACSIRAIALEIPSGCSGIGTPVELWGKEIKIDDVAAAAGTVGYELMCALALRVPVVTV